MIIDFCSDLHGYFPKLDGGDLLIIAGDLTASDKKEQHILFLSWLSKQEYRKKIWISGNHDNFLINTKYIPIKNNDMEYLCDSGTEFEGLKIWGTPWSLTFEGINPKCMAFTCDTEEELAVKFSLIPDDIDILISHSPPYGILDKCNNGNVGSKSLRNILDRTKPRLLVCGHIHEQGGKQIIYKRPGFGDENNTICINASYVDERYRPVNKVMRIEL